jgi:hypothetical protein
MADAFEDQLIVGVETTVLEDAEASAFRGGPMPKSKHQVPGKVRSAYAFMKERELFVPPSVSRSTCLQKDAKPKIG